MLKKDLTVICRGRREKEATRKKRKQTTINKRDRPTGSYKRDPAKYNDRSKKNAWCVWHWCGDDEEKESKSARKQ